MSEGSGLGADARSRVVETVLAFFEEGDLDPPPERVAERCGLPRHLVRDYLDDRETLLDDIITKRLAEIDPWLAPIPADGTIEERIATLVARRSEILEWLTPARLAAMRHELISPRMQMVRDAMYATAKARTAELFAPEFDPLPTEARAELLDVLDAVTMWGTWYHWRSAGLSTRQASRAMSVAVTAILDAVVARHKPETS
jgi:AcrR family transcriptional regulator